MAAKKTSGGKGKVHFNKFKFKSKGQRAKSAKNRKTKVHLVFNDQERKDFLKGFKKRKDERKAKAREEMELKLKEEKKRIREEHRNMMKKMVENQRTVPEIEHLLEPVTYDLPNHLVTITTNTDVDLAGHNDLRIGVNKVVIVENEDEEKDDSKETTVCDPKAMKKATMKSLKANKGYQFKQKLKQKKDRQKFRRQLAINKKKSKTKKRNLNKMNKTVRNE